jgi:uncharacterized repeat protein (TIGR01451 family)
VINHGPNATDDTLVHDPAPIPATITGHTVDNGNFDEATRTWQIPHLNNGETATLTVSVLVSGFAQGSYQNLVAIQQSRVTDPDPNNNTDTADLSVPAADIAVIKNVDDPAPHVGDAVTFTVNVTNFGPNTGDQVTIADVLPAGLAYVSSSATRGSYEPATGIWSVGDLDPVNLPAPEPQAVLSITARVTATGALTNTATTDRASAFPYDPETGNNTDTAVVQAEMPPADLSIVKTATPAGTTVGGQIVFTITLTNHGPGDATATTVSDTLPTATTPIRVSDSRCSISGQRVRCHLGAIPAGDKVTIRIRALANQAGQFTNTATATTTAADPTPENNRATAPWSAATSPAPPNPPTPNPGPDPEPPPGPGTRPGDNPPTTAGNLPPTGATRATAMALLFALVCLLFGMALITSSRRGATLRRN